MYVKKKSVEGYFSNSLTIATWKKGKAIFEEAVHNITNHPDGRFETHLVDAYFEMSKARPFSMFAFEMPDKTQVRKSILIDSAEGIARLVLDLSKFGIVPSLPSDLEPIYEKIRDRKYPAIITINTRDGIRNISVESSPREPAFEEKPKEIKPEIKINVAPTVPAPKESFKPILPAVAVPAEPKPSDGSVDIKAGDTITIKVMDGVARVKVLQEFPEDMELAVQFEDGNKKIVSATDIVGIG